MGSPNQDLALELNIRAEQVESTLSLSAGGATVPFIARYRKEATGGLDEVQIQAVIDRAQIRAELDDRRAAILRSIDEQGKLSPALGAAFRDATTKAQLEDLYLPFRPKRPAKTCWPALAAAGPPRSCGVQGASSMLSCVVWFHLTSTITEPGPPSA
jgi:transcriptional accessory protein Tex/SPT6